MNYRLFSNVIIVDGISRSAICDLQRNQIHLVPTTLSRLVVEGNIDADEVEKQLNDADKNILRDYVQYLLSLELIFECDSSYAGYFPELSLEWDFPATISNAVFDGITTIDYFNRDLLEQLRILGCRYMQIRLFKPAKVAEIMRIVTQIDPTEVRAVDMVISANSEEIRFDELILKIADEHPKIRCITIHSSDANTKLRGVGSAFGTVLKVTEALQDEKACGNIHQAYFAVNIETFTESQHHNTCLNRKISIDVDGNIRNCPSMSKSYGNIRDTKLIDVVNNPEFQKVWHIKKDEITKCKDCEFRHVCTDCRAYLEHPKDLYSAPLKCGYDPYTCTWEDWSLNPLKQKAMEYYELQPER